MNRKNVLSVLIVILFINTACAQQNQTSNQSKGKEMSVKIQKTDKEWKEILTPEQYNVLREKGTENLLAGNTGIQREKVFINVPLVELNF